MFLCQDDKWIRKINDILRRLCIILQLHIHYTDMHTDIQTERHIRIEIHTSIYRQWAGNMLLPFPGVLASTVMLYRG